MRRAALVLVLAHALALAGCGARTSLAARPDAEAPRIDAGAPTPPAPPPPSCWSEPNCIEADLELGGEPLAYREIATVDPMSRVLWLSGAPRGATWISVKLFRRASPGPNAFDPVDGDVFVTVYTEDFGCGLRDEIVLGPLDVSPGGVTEGTFGGPLVDCPAGPGRVRDGRFRLTAP